jgi:hypothetical protein
MFLYFWFLCCSLANESADSSSDEPKALQTDDPAEMDEMAVDSEDPHILGRDNDRANIPREDYGQYSQNLESDQTEEDQSANMHIDAEKNPTQLKAPALERFDQFVTQESSDEMDLLLTPFQMSTPEFQHVPSNPIESSQTVRIMRFWPDSAAVGSFAKIYVVVSPPLTSPVFCRFDDWQFSGSISINETVECRVPSLSPGEYSLWVSGNQNEWVGPVEFRIFESDGLSRFDIFLIIMIICLPELLIWLVLKGWCDKFGRRKKSEGGHGITDQTYRRGDGNGSIVKRNIMIT